MTDPKDQRDQDPDLVQPFTVEVPLVGFGQKLWYPNHRKADCTPHWCPMHNPSPHRLRSGDLHWRSDRALFERICKHGYGHPDPDDLAYKRRRFGDETADTQSVHGCSCGCCS